MKYLIFILFLVGCTKDVKPISPVRIDNKRWHYRMMINQPDTFINYDNLWFEIKDSVFTDNFGNTFGVVISGDKLFLFQPPTTILYRITYLTTDSLILLDYNKTLHFRK